MTRLRNRYAYRLRRRRMLLTMAIRGELPVRKLRAVAFAVSLSKLPLFQGGGPEITMTTTAAVTAGRLVEVSGNRSIAHAPASSQKCIGVAKQTGSAVGDKIGVATSGVWELTAQTAISAGDLVVVSAAGDGRVQSRDTINVATTPTEATIEAAFADALAVVGIALAAINAAATGPVLLKGLG